jgi:hypothetical protein
MKKSSIANGKGGKPLANNWTDKRLENVVFPDDDGPAMKTTRIWSRRLAI